MSNTQLVIPKTITVGYQERSDTYTKRLAYVIYTDAKGVLRKEKSWRGWCQLEDEYITQQVPNPNYKHNKPYNAVTNNYYLLDEDGKVKFESHFISKGLGSDVYDNTPTEGFVLNKGAGGYAGSSSSWNIRKETIRVYDPRGFEFEISIANLLFILENSNSYKGKGLEGEFVYSWEGTELVLLPAACDEYKKSQVFTNLQSGKVASKDLVEGGTYETKRQEKLVYMGRHMWFTFDGYYKKEAKFRKVYAFMNEAGAFVTQTGLTSIAATIDDKPISDYANRVEKFEKTCAFNLSKPKEFFLKPAKFNTKNRNYGWVEANDGSKFCQKVGDLYKHYHIYCKQTYEQKRATDSWMLGRMIDDIKKPLGYRMCMVPIEDLIIKNDTIIQKENRENHNDVINGKHTKWYTESEIEPLVSVLWLKMDSGKEVIFNK